MSLKVLHITVWETGGAGIAANRLHKGLLNEGIDSKILCLHKSSSDKKVFQFNKRRKVKIFERIFRKVKLISSNESKNKAKLKFYKGSFEEFTFPETDISLLDSELVKEADIINLHWIGRFVDYSSFFKGINKPIVWTLHDKNPAIGGFHLYLDKEKNPQMEKLEEEIRINKIKWIHQCKKLYVVSPSLFLMNFSKESEALKIYPHYHIHNSVDDTVFRKHDKFFARQIFNLPENKTLVLYLNSKGFHKGADIVNSCINTLDFTNLHFVALGGEDFENEHISFFSSIKEERLMSILYSAVDVFLIPSREDNLPNMMLESLVCGTPVIGSPIGGICEVIENGFNGMIVDDLTVESFNHILRKIDQAEIHFDRNAIRQAAISKFGLNVQAKKYIQIYKSII